MSRNQKKKTGKVKVIIELIIAMGIFTTIMLVLPCNKTGYSEHINIEYKGFKLIDRSKVIEGDTVYEVIDEDTGVHYYFGGGRRDREFMTPVYNSDGTIKIDKER